MNRQDSLFDQLRDLIPIADREGMYDAADYLARVVAGEFAPAQRDGEDERACPFAVCSCDLGGMPQCSGRGGEAPDETRPTRCVICNGPEQEHRGTTYHGFVPYRPGPRRAADEEPGR